MTSSEEHTSAEAEAARSRLLEREVLGGLLRPPQKEGDEAINPSVSLSRFSIGRVFPGFSTLTVILHHFGILQRLFGVVSVVVAENSDLARYWDSEAFVQRLDQRCDDGLVYARMHKRQQPTPKRGRIENVSNENRDTLWAGGWSRRPG